MITTLAHFREQLTFAETPLNTRPDEAGPTSIQERRQDEGTSPYT